MSNSQFSTETEIYKPLNVSRFKGESKHSPLQVRSFGVSDIGKIRQTNEDQYLIARLVKTLQIEAASSPQANIQESQERSYLFVVADGMGGHAGGEQASALAVESVETFVLNVFKWFAQFQSDDQEQVLADFHSALAQANARVLAKASERPELSGMGTTLTAAYSLNDVLFTAHVGDSRCYLRRDGVLHQLTRDHTLAAEMMRFGGLSAEKAARHPWQHVITNVVGGDSANVKVEVSKVTLKAGDSILLCSDGLTNMVADEEIAVTLQQFQDDPKEACTQLIAKANAAGGKDNITLVIGQFSDATGISENKKGP